MYDCWMAQVPWCVSVETFFRRISWRSDIDSFNSQVDDRRNMILYKKKSFLSNQKKKMKTESEIAMIKIQNKNKSKLISEHKRVKYVLLI